MDKEFSENGYKVIKNFIPREFCLFIQSYFKIRQDSLEYTIDDQCPKSKSFYADPLCETLLVTAGRKISDSIGVKLLPTYSYTRIYGQGENLVIHKDREECEYSATLSLGYPTEQGISPIFMSKNEDGSDFRKIYLDIGDICIYKGNEIFHWREPFKQTWYLQTFLHYVNSQGRYKNRLFDGRFALSTPKVTYD